MRRATLRMAAVAALVVAKPAAADTVSDWWEFANRITSAAQASATPDQQRALTRVSLAMFEAVNAIDRRYESYLGFPAGDRTASQDAAAASAAYHVLLHHFPAQKTVFDDTYAISMASIPDGAAKEAGRLIGQAAAAAAQTAGGIDSTIVQVPYRPRTEPGVWIGASLPMLAPHFAAYRPWAIPSADALMPPPPPAMGSERWARDAEEVRRLGARASTERTPLQTLMARFRELPDLTPSLRRAAEAPGRTMVQNARMFALLQMASDDATQAMVVAKLHYNFWRPITSIRNAADDGNDGTAAEAAWVPLLGTPNFPEYPCGHCAYAGALATVMQSEVGQSPAWGVRVSSGSVPNAVVQVLPSWDEWVRQVSDSRMYGGVHYRFSNDAGEEIGRRAARMVLERVARPLAQNARR
ncbi:MAG TPA: vanadium-dependent haloperoxidase [Longimicrobium sp.]|nr:vanadium-dependent haloperoxidase [Longimicrobium sp.]